MKIKRKDKNRVVKVNALAHRDCFYVSDGNIPDDKTTIYMFVASGSVRLELRHLKGVLCVNLSEGYMTVHHPNTDVIPIELEIEWEEIYKEKR